MSSLLRTLVATGALATFSAAASAAIYTSEAAFVAAAGSAHADLPIVLPASASFDAAPFSFSADPGQSFVISTATYGQAIGDEDNLPLNGVESHTLVASMPIYAFGFKIFQPSNAAPIPGGGQVACYHPCDAGSFTVSMSLGAAPVASFSFTPAYDTVEFHGYAGTAAFDTIRINDDSGSMDDEYFATYRYGAQPVPEPGTWALLLLGLAAVCARARPRARRLATASPHARAPA